MPSFPTMSCGAVAKHPLERSHAFRTAVLCAVDGSEQRFSKGYPLEEFSLTFTGVSTADKETIRAFWNARQGSLDTSWDLTLPAPSAGTWSNLQFTPGQKFAAQELRPGFWTFTLKVRQTR